MIEQYRKAILNFELENQKQANNDQEQHGNEVQKVFSNNEHLHFVIPNFV